MQRYRTILFRFDYVHRDSNVYIFNGCDRIIIHTRLRHGADYARRAYCRRYNCAVKEGKDIPPKI